MQPPDLHLSSLLISTATSIPTFYAGLYRNSLFVLQTPGCGNQVVEPSRSESCDDGNLTSGDGCSATCEAESLGAGGTGGTGGSSPSLNDGKAAGCSLIETPHSFKSR